MTTPLVPIWTDSYFFKISLAIFPGFLFALLLLFPPFNFWGLPEWYPQPTGFPLYTCSRISPIVLVFFVESICYWHPNYLSIAPKMQLCISAYKSHKYSIPPPNLIFLSHSSTAGDTITLLVPKGENGEKHLSLLGLT